MGKTRWACSAMRGYPEKWGDKALYVCIDPGSEELSSILVADLPHIVKEPFGEIGKPTDPYKELVRILESKRAEKEDCKTVILDTVSVASRSILQAVANSGKFSDKHVDIVSSGPGKLSLPMQGDYMAAQGMVMNILRMYKESGLNIIALFHDGLFEPEATSAAPSVGGPATVGKSALAPVAGWFHNLVRIEAKNVTEAGKRATKYFVYTEKKGPFLAKVRLRHPVNPIPEFELNPDPVNFWQKLKELES